MPGAYPRHLDAGELLFARGDVPWGMFLLETGRVHLRRFGRNGEEMTIATISPGQTFAEASLFSTAYHCDCVADESSRILVFPPRNVLRKIDEDAKFAKSLVHRLAIQLQECRMRSEVRGIRNAEERVTTVLGLRAGKDGCCRLAGTLKQFASEIGLTHEALYRTLSQLEAKGRIKREGRSIQLL